MQDVKFKDLNSFNIMDLFFLMCLLWFNGGLVRFNMYSALLNVALFAVTLFLSFILYPDFITKMKGYGLISGIIFVISVTLGYLLFSKVTTRFQHWELIYALMILIIFVYYSHRPSLIRKICLVCLLIDMIVMNFYTCYLLQFNSNISRIYAMGSEYVLKEGVTTYLLAGFFHVYATIPILLYLCLRWKDVFKLSKRYRILIITYFISALFLVIKANYATAILFLIFFCVGALFVNSKSGFINILTIFFVVILIFFSLTTLLEYLSDNLYTGTIVEHRFNDVLKFINGQGDNKNDINRRMEFMRVSFDNFLEFPLFGTVEKNIEIGGHTEWIDGLAYYGLLRYPFFIAFIIVSIRKVHEFINCSSQIVILYLCILILGFFNPFINQNFFLALYIIIPFIFMDYDYPEDTISEEIQV